jgi:hypothetical protein
MPDYGNVHSLSANATEEFHAMVEKACKVIGCDKATFIRLACRILVRAVDLDYSEEHIRQQAALDLPFSRSAYDVHKGLFLNPPHSNHETQQQGD